MPNQVFGILKSSDAKQTKRYSGLCDVYIGYNPKDNL